MDEIRKLMAEIIKRDGKKEGIRKIMSVLRDFDNYEEKMLKEWDDKRKNSFNYIKSHNQMVKELLEKERRMNDGNKE